MATARLPEILAFPPKLLPLYFELNDWPVFLITGGRSSGKTESAVRLACFLGCQQRLKVLVARETLVSLELSSYSVFKRIIQKYGLDYRIYSDKFVHNVTGTEIFFRGLGDNSSGGAAQKGFDAVDLFIVDEAQAVSEKSLEALEPTLIRNENMVQIYIMNRYMFNDPVWVRFAGRETTKVIEINYDENPYNNRAVFDLAEREKRINEAHYNHIWLNHPLEGADNVLFSSKTLHRQMSKIPDPALIHDLVGEPKRVMGIDFAHSGGDMCVCCVLDQVGLMTWKKTALESWSRTDAMESVGRIINYLSTYKPDDAYLDVGGMGSVVKSRLDEVGVFVSAFDGGTTKGIRNHMQNLRADAYYMLLEAFEDGHLFLDKDDTQLFEELMTIQMRWTSSGAKGIKSKKEMSKSPDLADAIMMAWYAAKQSQKGILSARPHTWKGLVEGGNYISKGKTGLDSSGSFVNSYKIKRINKGERSWRKRR